MKRITKSILWVVVAMGAMLMALHFAMPEKCHAIVGMPYYSGYVTHATSFASGGSQAVKRTSALVTVTDGKIVSGSIWFRVNASADGFMQTLFGISTAGATSRCLQVARDGNNVMRILGGDGAGNTYLDAVGSVTVLGSSVTWHHFYFYFDLSDVTKRAMVLDGTIDSGANWSGTYVNANLKLTGELVDVAYDEHGGGQFSGCLSEAWFAPGTYFTNYGSFRSTTHPANIGAQGQTPTGTAPKFYLNQVYSSWQLDQSGNGNDFTVYSGPLTDCSTAP